MVVRNILKTTDKGYLVKQVFIVLKLNSYNAKDSFTGQLILDYFTQNKLLKVFCQYFQSTIFIANTMLICDDGNLWLSTYMYHNNCENIL